jgi:hypothetical protein
VPSCSAWETLNDLFEFTRENLAAGISRRGRYAYMKRVIDYCQLLTGNPVITAPGRHVFFQVHSRHKTAAFGSSVYFSSNLAIACDLAIRLRVYVYPLLPD